MADREHSRARGEEQVLQLPLFGGEQAARLVGEMPMPTQASNLRHANTWFGLHLASLKYSPNTIESYTTSVELLARLLGDSYALEGIGAKQLQCFLHWLAERDGKAPVKTLALRVTGLRKFFETLVARGVLGSNPAEDLYAPLGEVPLPEVLTPVEEARLRELAWSTYHSQRHPDPRPLFLTMLTLDLGLRRGELETLTRSQVEIGQPQVTIRIHYRERRHRYKNRTLPTPPQFREVYRDYLHQYPPAAENRPADFPRIDDKVLTASRRTLHRVVERLGAKIGAAARVTPMVMRWTRALHWYNELPPQEVQRLLGLSPIGWQDAERVLQALRQRQEQARASSVPDALGGEPYCGFSWC